MSPPVNKYYEIENRPIVSTENADRIYSSPTFRRKDSPTKGMPEVEVPPVQVLCQYCFRRFNEKAAERHIPKCANVKSRPRPPPTKRSLMQQAEKRKSLVSSQSKTPDLDDSKIKLKSKISQAQGGLKKLVTSGLITDL